MLILLIYLFIGIVAGFTGGLFGVGGGAVTVPLLLYAFSLQGISPQVMTHMALATSLAAMVVTATSSVITHHRLQGVLWAVFGWLSMGVVLGSVIGTSTAAMLSGATLQIALGLFFIYVGTQMIVGFKPAPTRTLPSPKGLAGVGTVIGAVSMYFGIGGGSLTVPFLHWCGVSPKQASGTSAALGLPIAIFGALMYLILGWGQAELPAYSAGYVYLPAFAGIILTSAPFARLGARLAHQLPGHRLRQAFSLLLFAVAAHILWQNLG